MGPVEVKILLSLGGWLSHGQSCHISYFYTLEFLFRPFQNTTMAVFFSDWLISKSLLLLKPLHQIKYNLTGFIYNGSAIKTVSIFLI